MSGLTDEEKELVSAIVAVSDGFGGGLAELLKNIAHQEHRTHQQSITRFCKAWLTICGDEEYGYDGRNESSAELGKKFVEAGLSDHYLPYI